MRHLPGRSGPWPKWGSGRARRAFDRRNTAPTQGRSFTILPVLTTTEICPISRAAWWLVSIPMSRFAALWGGTCCEYSSRCWVDHPRGVSTQGFAQQKDLLCQEGKAHQEKLGEN